MALAVAIASSIEQFDRSAFFGELLSACESPEYRTRLEQASQIQHPDELAHLGNRIEALHSVPTAIASFALSPGSYEATISHVIFLGGDTDTLAAMAGAISGAHLGAGQLPQRLINLLEKSPHGRDYLIKLADELLGLRHRQ